MFLMKSMSKAPSNEARRRQHLSYLTINQQKPWHVIEMIDQNSNRKNLFTLELEISRHIEIQRNSTATIHGNLSNITYLDIYIQKTSLGN